MSTGGETPVCALCHEDAPREDVVRGRSLWVCRRCVERGMAHTLERAGDVAEGQTLPRAYVTCSYCANPTPPTALYGGREGAEAVSICTCCLRSGYELLTAQIELQARRRISFAKPESALASTLLTEHFGELGPGDVVTSSRTFPG